MSGQRAQRPDAGPEGEAQGVSLPASPRKADALTGGGTLRGGASLQADRSGTGDRHGTVPGSGTVPAVNIPRHDIPGDQDRDKLRSREMILVVPATETSSTSFRASTTPNLAHATAWQRSTATELTYVGRCGASTDVLAHDSHPREPVTCTACQEALT